MDVGPLDVTPLNVFPLDVRQLNVRTLNVRPLDVTALDVRLLDVSPLDVRRLDITTTSFIYMTIQTHTVLQKRCLGIKITTQGNYATLIIICHEHQNKLKYIL